MADAVAEGRFIRQNRPTVVAPTGPTVVTATA
jgi:hypothetical protein